MLGLNTGFHPRFLRRYMELYDGIKGAISTYIEDVKTQDFPNESESY
jgi:3-methyl-2-oxobutanoate hydroxymethyltransferase